MSILREFAGGVSVVSTMAGNELAGDSTRSHTGLANETTIAYELVGTR